MVELSKSFLELRSKLIGVDIILQDFILILAQMLDGVKVEMIVDYPLSLCYH